MMLKSIQPAVQLSSRAVRVRFRGMTHGTQKTRREASTDLGTCSPCLLSIDLSVMRQAHLINQFPQATTRFPDEGLALRSLDVEFHYCRCHYMLILSGLACCGLSTSRPIDHPQWEGSK